MTKVEIDGKIYCVETLLYTIDRLKKDLLAEVELRKNILDDIKAEIRKLEWYGDDAFWDGVNAVSDIIDKHIGQRSRVNEFCE